MAEREFRKFIELTVRPVIFTMIPLVFFGIISAKLFSDQQYDWFQRLGSLIVVWAVFNLSNQRERYSTAIARGERLRITRHLNQIREMTELQTKTLNLTFDLHASQIAQIGAKVDQPTAFVQNDPDSIRAFCQDIERRLEASTVVAESAGLIEKLREYEGYFQNAMVTNSKWLKTIWYIEVVLLVWGTVQWGYGDLLVTWYHGIKTN
jgi:hypothetical protein